MVLAVGSSRPRRLSNRDLAVEFWTVFKEDTYEVTLHRNVPLTSRVRFLNVNVSLRENKLFSRLKSEVRVSMGRTKIRRPSLSRLTVNIYIYIFIVLKNQCPVEQMNR